MKDRRFYQRLNTDIDALIYIQGIEIKAKIIDISENGVCFEADTDKLDLITINKKLELRFQFVDYITICDREKEYIKHILGNIIYWQNKKDKTIIGCSVKSNDFAKYVLDKKTEEFLKYKQA